MRFVCLVFVALFFTILFEASSNAAENEQTSETSLTYKAIVKPDGTIDLQPTNPAVPAKEKFEARTFKGKGNSQRVPEGNVIQNLLAGQKVLIHESASGTLEGVYVFPKDKELPVSVMNSLQPGDYLKFASRNDDWFLQAEESVRQTIVALLNKARLTACSLDPRPVQFGATAEIGAGIGISGAFSFNALWDTADLCK